MSKDIRSFFTVISKKPGTDSGSSSSKSPKVKTKKRKPAIQDSDNEDIIEATPDKRQSKVDIKKRRVQVISSDSEDDFKEKKSFKKSNTKDVAKLKPVNITEVFGNTPIKQSKVEPLPKTDPENSVDKKVETKKKRKQKLNTEIGIHNDEDFEKTLLELDDDLLLQNVDILDRTIDAAMQNKERAEVQAKDEDKKLNLLTNSEATPMKEHKKRQRKDSEGTASKKPKLDHTDSGIDPDQEAFEKKRYSAMLYQKYKHRGGPKHHGSKDLPQGKPDCLKNITFLRTGVLDSLEGDEFENLVKEHGGRVVHSVSKKVNYLVVGDDPGPVKLDKARGLNIPMMSEDDLLDMILVKSGMKPKFCKSKSETSVESGIATEEDISPKHRKNDKSPTRDKKYKDRNENKPTKDEQLFVKVENSNGDNKTDIKPNFKKLSQSTSDIKNTTIKTEQKGKREQQDKKKLHKKETASLVSKPGCSKIVKSEDLPQIDRPNLQVADTSKSWTEKYKPTNVKAVIGQQDENSNMNKLGKWLKSWYRNQQPEVHKKIPRPSPWAKNDDGAYFKAALLSGPPGVGKTTTATLVSKELGFDVVEFNASDTRSKRLLHEEVSQLLSTNTIAGFAAGKKTTDKKRVLLMDEVDGMAGNEDRGGMQELINLIKNSSVPIICMCNDRNHQKMRSLVNYCFDLKFNKPRVEQVRGAMMSICYKEGIKIAPSALAEIINGTGCDIRQTLNHLSMWSAGDKNLSMETVEKESKASKKDTVLGPWEVVKLVFTESEQKKMSLSDKSRLFFYDYSLGPLFVQENYLNVTPNCSSKEVMKRVALAADAISMGDVLDAKIRGSNNWSLLESQAMYSSVLPGFYMAGNVTKRINFPGWLGKNSSANKLKRLLSELHIHTRTSTSGSKLAMKLDYLVPLRNAIINPLRKYGTEGVHQAIEVMKAYNLLREDLNNLVELCQWKDTKNPFNDIDAKVKSAFTRAYNKEAPLLPFAAGAGVSKKRTAAIEPDPLEDEEIESDTEETDDVTSDAMIKIKTKADNKGKSKKDTKASSSKAKDAKSNKGKGKKTK